MEENMNIVTEEVAENAETTAEETTQAAPEKLYTEEDFRRKVEEVAKSRVARNNAKIRKEYEQKYGDLERVLKAGTGKEDVSEITQTFADFYESKGIKVQRRQDYNDRDIEVLAQADAQDIIRGGYEEVKEEVDRLARIGVDKMTQREKALFMALSKSRQNTERGQELAKIGVTEAVYNSKEFTDFAGKFASNTPITEIYQIYEKTQKPQKEIKTAGSMKNTAPENGVKEFYTPDEAKKFTMDDLNKNPSLYEAIKRSMLRW